MKIYPKTIALIAAELHKVVIAVYWSTNLASQYQDTLK
jgi:ABC-type enterochelin transport system ATPase subunit